MKLNGVKAKKNLLLVTMASCSFLIYQLTFCVQNSCISNSPHKMSARSGTVSWQRTAFHSLCGGLGLPCCQAIAPVTGHTQLLSASAGELQLPPTLLLSTLFLKIEHEGLIFLKLPHHNDKVKINPELYYLH